MFHTRDGRILPITELGTESIEIYVPRIELSRVNHRTRDTFYADDEDDVKHRISIIPKQEEKKVPMLNVSVQKDPETAGIKSWSCVPCNVNFLHKLGLKAHFKSWEHSVQLVGETKAVEFIYNCQFCGQLFEEQQDRDNHETSHKAFSCNICSNRFTQSGQLSIHMRIHTLERPFQCPACKKCFNQRTHMQRHLKTHLDVKEFQCSKCSMRFTQRSNLNRHLEAHKNGTLKFNSQKYSEGHKKTQIKIEAN